MGLKNLLKKKMVNLGVDGGKIYQTGLSFSTIQRNGHGESPHISGYLVSASDADKGKYRLKGWFNEDGTIRIELVD